jgi:hypothetical protein
VTYAKVGAIVVAAATAAGIAVGFAGGATAASQHSKAVTHHSKTTARLETNTNPVNPDTRDIGFTG